MLFVREETVPKEKKKEKLPVKTNSNLTCPKYKVTKFALQTTWGISKKNKYIRQCL